MRVSRISEKGHDISMRRRQEYSWRMREDWSKSSRMAPMGGMEEREGLGRQEKEVEFFDVGEKEICRKQM